ncbi:leucine-rich repeat and transmembrane domain-containing protein 1-like [Saccostrea echinata]|uniref:leucine-rich repeat and transmembrane domain-containing protein 1-like n=1 Tax=Saccostrea echinata TaxID=191078 RepID=UPI002A8204A5|nr:leucine-rich repeat and transmembrane domain-containing protein 1-like [Saccostrea echinata]
MGCLTSAMNRHKYVPILFVMTLFSFPARGGISTSLFRTACQRPSSGCSCATDPNGLSVTCDGNGTSLFPSDLPAPAIKITLLDYQVSNLNRTDFFGAENLTELNIINCKIQTLDEWAFDHLQNLHKINLTQNELSVVGKYDFYHLVYLREIDLSLNKISYIAGDAFYSLHNLRDVYLFGNPLHCDCEMQRFLNWINLRKENVSVVNALCANSNNTLLNETKDFGICQGEHKAA